jgi:hypothetical protein
MLSHTSKDTTTVFEKRNIAWGMPIPTFTTEEPEGGGSTCSQG